MMQHVYYSPQIRAQGQILTAPVINLQAQYHTNTIKKL